MIEFRYSCGAEGHIDIFAPYLSYEAAPDSWGAISAGRGVVYCPATLATHRLYFDWRPAPTEHTNATGGVWVSGYAFAYVDGDENGQHIGFSNDYPITFLK
ncbi:hypothetical protein AB0I60_02815 [Actinosynnema sp. NPDC050436]|uniref:hypothetical protein n=1 Tax=Actinosynnema sp. NPDC050436 TaxID=3155659 RepID=UPI003406AF15